MMQTVRWLLGWREPEPTVLDRAIAEHENAVTDRVRADQRAKSVSQAIIRDAGRTMRMVADSWEFRKKEPLD
jgi:hypothetical protein